MLKHTFVPLALLATLAAAKPVHLRCEHLDDPLGIDVAQPRLSWRADNTERNWRQSAYQILVASAPEKLKADAADVWDSGKQPSADSVGIAYAGGTLETRKRYYWSVRTWDADGKVSESAAPAWWEMALLAATDWNNAQWIRWQNPEDTADRARVQWTWVPDSDALAVMPNTKVHFRATVDVARMPSNAAIFAVARGDYKIKVNGVPAGGKTAWALFDRQEITTLLTPGTNVIEIDMIVPQPPLFGPGAGPPDSPRVAGFAALVKFTFADGSIERIPTGSRWQARLDSEANWKSAVVAGALDDKRFGGDPGPFPQPAALLRHKFTTAAGKRVLAARAYVTALGSYRFFLNGKRVGNDVLTPDFVDYAKRVPYQTYDVTPMILSEKPNVAAATLGDGWFASGMSWNGQHFSLLPPTRFLAVIAIDYADGSHDVIPTDSTWKAARSPILHSEIYWGEVYDARLEQPGWNGAAAFDDSKWTSAIASEGTPGVVSAQMTAPARMVATVRPVSVKESAPGVHVFDMGQNMVGWIALSAAGKAGTTVRMRFAEILNPDGSIYRENLRNADANDFFTLKGIGVETFRPTFTFHGFRYVEVTGYPGKPRLSDVAGEVVSSLGGEPAARLTTSSELVNRMWKIGIWGQRGNFVTVPTDCPQRDERLGWTGDAAAFWRTGSYNFDIASFTHKWMADMRDAQTAAGAFPNVAPDIGLGVSVEGAPGWGDAGVIVPWTAWQQYGDTSYIERNWEAMDRWMKFIEGGNPDFVRRNRVGPNFADWLAVNSETPKDLVATAYWALMARMMAEMAAAFHRDGDAMAYAAKFDRLRAAFGREFVKAGGVVGSGSQTSLLLPLYLDLLDESSRPAAMDRLVKDIDAHGEHLTTGFLGTPFLLFTLAKHGRSDVAYKLLLSETYPSWGYMLSKGATTWWERWNGDTGDPAMNSFNHYAFGSVVAWVYRSVAAIDAGAPGFKEIVIRPRQDARMQSARGEYDSIYGRIVSDWHVAGVEFVERVVIPPNTSATIYLPLKPGARVTEGGKPVESRPGPDGTAIVAVGSGNYEFRVR